MNRTLQRTSIAAAILIASLIASCGPGHGSDTRSTRDSLRSTATADRGPTTDSTSEPHPAAPASDPHHHPDDVLSQPPDPEIGIDIHDVMVAPPDEVRKQITASADGRYRAFTTTDPSGWRIYVEDMVTGAVAVIRGLPLPHRPFDDLVWTSPDVLVFDRWSGPHYGTHYAVDVARRRLLLASHFRG